MPHARLVISFPIEDLLVLLFLAVLVGASVAWALRHTK